MRKLHTDSNFWLALMLNMLFHFEGTIPAWILLILHFVIGLSIKWFWIALGIWIAVLLLSMLIWGKITGWAVKCGDTPDPPKKNVNPYSVRSSQKQKDESSIGQDRSSI